MDTFLADPRWQCLLGFPVFWGTAWLFSENRGKRPDRRLFISVFAFQLALAAIFLQVPAAGRSLSALNKVVLLLSTATNEATGFLFGYVGRATDLPFAEAAEQPGSFYILAFQGLPLIIVVSALCAVLWHWGLLKWLIKAFAAVLTRLFGTSGPVALSGAANVILGLTEAPLLIRPLLKRLTRSELFAVIACGFATVVGTVMTLYAAVLVPLDSNVLGHIFVASILAVPAALLFAQIIVPPSGEESRVDVTNVSDSFAYKSTMDAFTAGATEGGKLWANVVVSLLAFLAAVALINLILAELPSVGGAPITLERIIGLIFAPFVWLTGIPWDQVAEAGQLMGTKTILNEFVAYLRLAELSESSLDARSRLIMIYALCGFANIGTLGIIIGGLGSLEPARRDEVVAMAPKALVAGTLATLSSAAAVGLWA